MLSDLHLMGQRLHQHLSKFRIYIMFGEDVGSRDYCTTWAYLTSVGHTRKPLCLLPTLQRSHLTEILYKNRAAIPILDTMIIVLIGWMLLLRFTDRTFSNVFKLTLETIAIKGTSTFVPDLYGAWRFGSGNFIRTRAWSWVCTCVIDIGYFR